MKRRHFSMILVAAVFLSLLYPPGAVLAVGDGNIDNSGGDLGSGTSENIWHGGDDGVRVTVVTADDGNVEKTPIDLTNIDASGIEYSFGKVCKKTYNNGQELVVNGGDYVYKNPGETMPRIISSSSVSASIDEIKSYFTDKLVVEYIAGLVGMDYDTLISGDYKLLLEPIAYFTFQGYKFAMTATEAAMYDKLLNGGLRSLMGSLTHKNLPLAMYLDIADLGYKAFSVATATSQSNATIIDRLGIGIVSFGEEEGTVIGGGDGEYEYRTDTDVITAVTVANKGVDISPDDDAAVKFKINGKTYSKSFICPSGSSQLVWVKWHTPDDPQTLTIKVSAKGFSTKQLEDTEITADIVELTEVTPPDTEYYQDNPYPDFQPKKTPSYGKNRSATWTVWNADWVEPVYGVDEHGNRYIVEPGYWDYYPDEYSVTLKADYELTPDSRVQTAEIYGDDWEMKSAYGVNVDCETAILTEGNPSLSEDYTAVQNVVATFPEFDFETYNRLLEPEDGGTRTDWHFRDNIESYYRNKVHFVPLWYPDETYYVVPLAVFDVWTPCGMLYTTVDDRIYINGNVYDDWYIHTIE